MFVHSSLQLRRLWCMSLKLFLIIASILTAITLPIAIRLSWAGNIIQSLNIKPLEKLKNAVQPLGAKQANVEQILKTKKCGGCNLTGINLSGARLNDAKLINADLDGADFKGSEFKGADLSDAQLLNAVLNKANLSTAI